MNVANFGAIDGGPVFGACRPGHLGGDLEAWTEILGARGVETVVCLLSKGEARRWRLPAAYEGVFETAHVPIRDRYLPSGERLSEAVGILERATADGGRVAIHCNAGLGRTGVVAAGWLVRDRGLSAREAVDVVESRPWPRAPREAVRDGNASEGELYGLLEGM
ncbi:dual specificity protein phosphatase family protein [Natrialbaceae archaeon GCM10025810]|uniref:protein-tyrosine phosphatase family protein n=1 Tax=Halovalidus salilacus TaxID=3075124 RepID=UPI003619C6DC